MLMADELEALVARWRTDEDRLYPMVMVAPERYQEYLTLVRAVADKLSSIPTAKELGDAFGAATDIVVAVAEASATQTEALDLDMVAGAAFSLRYREILEEVRRSDAVATVRRANEAGRRWVVVHEVGTPESWQARPYRLLEMHLPEGTGIYASIELDVDTYSPVYAVEVVQLDPHTGDFIDGSRPLQERESFDDPKAWQARVDVLRLQVGSRGGPS